MDIKKEYACLTSSYTEVLSKNDKTLSMYNESNKFYVTRIRGFALGVDWKDLTIQIEVENDKIISKNPFTGDIFNGEYVFEVPFLIDRGNSIYITIENKHTINNAFVGFIIDGYKDIETVSFNKARSKIYSFKSSTTIPTNSIIEDDLTFDCNMLVNAFYLEGIKDKDFSLALYKYTNESVFKNFVSSFFFEGNIYPNAKNIFYSDEDIYAPLIVEKDSVMKIKYINNTGLNIDSKLVFIGVEIEKNV